MKLEADATIAVVGASARAAAFSLLRGGFRVVAADLFADGDLARQCSVACVASYPEGFEAWLAKTQADAWMYTGALENYPELVDRLASSRPLLGCSGETLRRVRDPLELQRTLTAAGLSFPETRRSADVRTVDDTWIGKTYRGSSGSGVGGTEAAPYLQRRVAGTPLSAVFRGSKLLGITRQLVGETWTGASEFQYCGTIGPWSVPPGVEQQVRRLGKIFEQKFGLTSLYGVDLLLDGEKLWTLEVNPRYTAAVEVVERAYGISAFATGEFPRSRSYVGKVVVFTRQPVVISESLSYEWLEQAEGSAWPKLADIPTGGTEIAAGHPILTVFETAGSSKALEVVLRQRVAEIETQLYGELHECD